MRFFLLLLLLPTAAFARPASSPTQPTRAAATSTIDRDLITIRGDRFVIPVRSELKRRVSGVVHGSGSSGQTVYVEPLETIEQNNELVRLMEEEQAEIHRIFVALTRQVATVAFPLTQGAGILALVDSLLARARFASSYNCVDPLLTPESLNLKAARHPLLEKHLRSTGGHVATATGRRALARARDYVRELFEEMNE